MRQTHVTTAWQPWPLNSKVCNLGHNDLLLRLGLISSFVGLDLHLLLLFLGSLTIRVWSFFTVCFSPLFFSDLSCLYGPIILLNSVFIQVHLILKNILPRLEESGLECFSVVYGRKSYGQRLETRNYSFFTRTHGGWVTHLLLRLVLLAQGVGKVCLCFPHPRLLTMLTLGQIGLRRSPSESHNWVEGPSRAGLNGWHTSEEHFVRFHVSAWTYPHRFLSSHDYPSRACLWMTHNFHLDQW